MDRLTGEDLARRSAKCRSRATHVNPARLRTRGGALGRQQREAPPLLRLASGGTRYGAGVGRLCVEDVHLRERGAERLGHPPRWRSEITNTLRTDPFRGIPFFWGFLGGEGE